MEKRYSLQMEVREEELRQVMDEMKSAQEKIMECCFKLERMGVLVIRKDTAGMGGSAEQD